MRPCCFHSRNVTSCVFTSTRLCTCIRSIRFARKSLRERSIDSIPFCFPRVQTFVARKSFSRIPSDDVSSPITYKARENVFQLASDLRSKIDIEGPPRPEADHGKFLARTRNDARQHR